MSVYSLKMQTINTGSENVGGHCTECFLTIASVTEGQDPKTYSVMTKNIKNNQTYTEFRDTKTNEVVDGIEINDADEAGLVVVYSIYTGIRALDAVIVELIKKVLAQYIGDLIKSIDIKYVDELLQNKLKAVEKNIYKKMIAESKEINSTIAVDTFTNLDQYKDAAGNLSFVMRSDVTIEDILEIDTYIEEGDKAITLKLNKQ